MATRARARKAVQPARHVEAPTGRITIEQVMAVSLNAQPCPVPGTDYTLTIDELMKLTMRGDWESGYYQLTALGAARTVATINRKLQAEKVPATSC